MNTQMSEQKRGHLRTSAGTDLDFSCNELVADGISYNLVRFCVASDYDPCIRAVNVVIECRVWPDRESFNRHFHGYTTFTLRPTGEWIRCEEGQRAEVWSESRSEIDTYGLSSIHRDKVELERLKDRYIKDMSRLAAAIPGGEVCP